jgi:hypothetical protein
MGPLVAACCIQQQDSSETTWSELQPVTSATCLQLIWSGAMFLRDRAIRVAAAAVMHGIVFRCSLQLALNTPCSLNLLELPE